MADKPLSPWLDPAFVFCSGTCRIPPRSTRVNLAIKLRVSSIARNTPFFKSSSHSLENLGKNSPKNRSLRSCQQVVERQLFFFHKWAIRAWQSALSNLLGQALILCFPQKRIEFVLLLLLTRANRVQLDLLCREGSQHQSPPIWYRFKVSGLGACGSLGTSGSVDADSLLAALIRSTQVLHIEEEEHRPVLCASEWGVICTLTAPFALKGKQS